MINDRDPVTAFAIIRFLSQIVTDNSHSLSANAFASAAVLKEEVVLSH